MRSALSFSVAWRALVSHLESDGSLDSTFSPGAGAVMQIPSDHTEVRTVLALPQGGVFIGGAFDLVGGAERNFMARLQTEGVSTPPVIGGATILDYAAPEDGAPLRVRSPGQ